VDVFHPTSGAWWVWFTLGSLLLSFFRILFVAKIHHFASFNFILFFIKKGPKQHGQKEFQENFPKK
jgi:hypothetical protein